MTYNGPERRNSVRLHPDDREAITRILTLLEDENVGLCHTVRKLNEAVNGNGSIGLKAKVLITQIILASTIVIIGVENPVSRRLFKYLLSLI